MTDAVDEGMIIAWLDGETDAAASARVAEAVAADPALAELAERHRRLKARFASAFGPIADEPVAMPEPPSAPVISLAAARDERAARAAAGVPHDRRRWALPGAIAASLLVGVFVGHGLGGRSGIADSPDALALAAPISAALDRQLSGEAGAVRVALSFRDEGGNYCRGFAASRLAGVACHVDGGWRLRYASPAKPGQGDYRMAGGEDATMRFIQSAMAGEPLDREAEARARANHWRD